MDRARLKLHESVGYAATDLSVMLAGACWGTIAGLVLVRRKCFRAMVLAGAGVVAFGQALTGGRGGYVAWGLAGLVLCLVKWHKHLLLAPLVLILLPVVLPGVTARMLEGFGHIDVAGQATVDEEAATSGRLLIWPYVIDKIGESPMIGYGRLAMKRTGLFDRIEVEFPGTSAPHPHNMYLETLLDNGILGSIPIWLFWATTVIYAARLFRSANGLYSAVGGLALALVLTSLIGGIAGQHFYPQEHTLGLWAAAFLSLRVYVEEKRAQASLTRAWRLSDSPAIELRDEVAAFPCA
jgi:O-antigen ligase